MMDRDAGRVRVMLPERNEKISGDMNREQAQEGEITNETANEDESFAWLGIDDQS